MAIEFGSPEHVAWLRANTPRVRLRRGPYVAGARSYIASKAPLGDFGRVWRSAGGWEWETSQSHKASGWQRTRTQAVRDLVAQFG